MLFNPLMLIKGLTMLYSIKNDIKTVTKIHENVKNLDDSTVEKIITKSLEKRFWQSKKFISMLVGLVVYVLNQKFGLNLDPYVISGLICTYMISQGVADHGKGKK